MYCEKQFVFFLLILLLRHSATLSTSLPQCSNSIRCLTSCMPREQAVILTKRDFRLLPKAKLDALVASTSSTSLFFGSASPRQAQRATREAQLDAVVGKGVEAEEPVENSVCFDLTTGPKLEPRPAGGYSPKPPTRSERILHGSYTTAGSIVPRQQGVSGAAIAKAASSHALTDMELYEQLSRLRTVTTGRNDIFDGGHDTIHALVESLRAVYRHIPVEMVALKALAGATLHSTVASMYFDMQCSSSPRFATAPAGTCRSLEQLTDYSSVSSAMTTGSSTSGIAVSPSCISHKLHAIAVENELLAERERLALLRRQFEEMQHTLRNYEKQAKKEPKCALSSALVVAGKLKNSPQDDPLAVATDSDDESSRLQLAIVENDRLRAALADRDDVISRQSCICRESATICRSFYRRTWIQRSTSQSSTNKPWNERQDTHHQCFLMAKRQSRWPGSPILTSRRCLVCQSMESRRVEWGTIDGRAPSATTVRPTPLHSFPTALCPLTQRHFL